VRERETSCRSRFFGKYSSVFFSTSKVKPQGVLKKIILALLRYFFQKPCLWEHSTVLPSNRERQEVPIIIIGMKTNNITSANWKKWMKIILILIVAPIGFSYLYRHGISPVWAAVAIVIFPGFFRFIYKIACFIVAMAIIFAILSFLIF
jgi:hypothetical protein